MPVEIKHEGAAGYNPVCACAPCAATRLKLAKDGVAQYPGDLGKDDDKDGGAYHHLTRPVPKRQVIPLPSRPPTSGSEFQDVQIEFTDHYGVRRFRKVRPYGITYCSSTHYPQAQWMLEAMDLEDGKRVKFFPFAKIHFWIPRI